MANNQRVPELLHQLNMTINPDNTWKVNTQIQNVMFVSPDLQFAWLFRITPQEQVFPSNDTHYPYFNCHLYVRDVSQVHTVSKCLERFGIGQEDSDFQVINIIGELIEDPTQAPTQTVCLTSK
jgi:hypothetical protein